MIEEKDKDEGRKRKVEAIKGLLKFKQQKMEHLMSLSKALELTKKKRKKREMQWGKSEPKRGRRH